MSEMSICSIDFDMSSTENGMLHQKPFWDISNQENEKGFYQQLKKACHVAVLMLI